MDAALLPVKRLDRAKRRLGPVFTQAHRTEIAAALLEDALDLCSAADFLAWVVVSDDPAVRDEAKARGIGALADPGGGLNAALSAGVNHAVAAGAVSITVIPCDVPLARVEDLVDVLDTGATSDMVLVPSERDGGTNGLHLRPPDVAEPHFGAESLAAHVALAERLALRCSILRLPRLTLDIDTPEDIDAFMASADAPSTHTFEVLRALRTG
jgi:2-phospho-L-lactate guanylyltransferase